MEKYSSIDSKKLVEYSGLIEDRYKEFVHNVKHNQVTIIKGLLTYKKDINNLINVLKQYKKVDKSNITIDDIIEENRKFLADLERTYNSLNNPGKIIGLMKVVLEVSNNTIGLGDKYADKILKEQEDAYIERVWPKSVYEVYCKIIENVDSIDLAILSHLNFVDTFNKSMLKFYKWSNPLDFKEYLGLNEKTQSKIRAEVYKRASSICMDYRYLSSITDVFTFKDQGSLLVGFMYNERVKDMRYRKDMRMNALIAFKVLNCYIDKSNLRSLSDSDKVYWYIFERCIQGNRQTYDFSALDFTIKVFNKEGFTFEHYKDSGININDLLYKEDD